MKRFLSVILCACMLLALAITPIPAQASEADYEATTLGGYYKFTFSKDEIYNYAFGADATYKNNTFKPLHGQANIGAKVGYKQVTDSITGAKYDTLELVNGALFNFTPLTKDGQPYELTPGNEYRVKIKMFNPVSNAWVHAFMCVGQENNNWGKFIEIDDGKYNYTSYPYNTTASLSNQGGMGWHYMLKDGTYGKTSTFTNYNNGVCLHTLDESYGLTCSHGRRTVGSPYLEQERTFSLPVDHFEYDQENMSYSATRTVYTQSGSEYVPTGETLTVNNYLTFYFGGGNVSSYAKQNYPLYGNAEYSDLFNENGTAKNNYTVWQIESIEIWETVVGKVTLHMGDTVKTVTGEIGTAIDLASPVAPDGKYVICWYVDPKFKNPVTAAPAFSESALHLYAKLGTYADGVTYNLQDATQPTLKNYEYMNNGALTSVTLNESGWAYKEYTADGVVLGKGDGGNAYKWNPSNTTGFAQTTSSKDYVALTSDVAVGEQIMGGWGAYSNYVLRDEDGNPAIAKPNTRYAVTVTYEKLSHGEQNIAIGVGRKADQVSSGANDKGNGTYNRFCSSTYSVKAEEITGENSTHTFYVNTGNFSAGDVPVFSIHNNASGYVVERVAAVNGVKSYKVNGTTYYPYKIISYARIAVKEVQLIEIDSGNVAVTYNYYEKGEGFNAVLKEAAPETALEPTKNVDGYWHDVKEGRNNIYTTCPYENVVLYNAEYYMEHDEQYSDTPIFGDKTHVTPVTLNEGGEEIYALKFNATDKVTLDDAQVLRIGKVADGHTYKFTASFKADEMNTDLKLVLTSAGNANALGGRNVTGTKLIEADSVTRGKWTTVTYYFTADPRGVVIDTEEYGFDYWFADDNASLFLNFVQDNAGKNTVYLADVRVEDLGEVITTVGASVLTDEAAQLAGQQATRYFFSYNTANGNTITLGGESFKVVERGFIYKNGTLVSGATEVSDFFATNNRVQSSSKTSGFDRCWAYEGGVLTFSTYVKNLDINDDTRKIQVKAYLLVEDADGNRFHIYSNSINRSVDAIKNGDPNARRLVWSEEFNVGSISEIDTFTQKYDTMTSSDSNLTLSTSENNYFVDPNTGELVLRITSDGNRNYTTAKSVTTRDIMSYRYGYLEMRAKVPYQKCVWPSFWMQPDKSAWNKTEYTGEIDIFEVMGSETVATANLHKWYSGSSSCTSGAGNTHYLDGYNNPNYKFSSKAEANDYHLYGFEWNEEFMAFYIDGNLYCKIDITEETGDYCAIYHPGMDCFHNYYYISLNNWLFTDQDTWVSASNRVENNPDFGTVDYRIDYIRLYQNRTEDIYIY